MNKFEVEYLEGYGPPSKKICTMDNFVSEEFNLDAYWGYQEMVEKLRELLTSKVGDKVTLANCMGEKVVATKISTGYDDVRYTIKHLTDRVGTTLGRNGYVVWDNCTEKEVSRLFPFYEGAEGFLKEIRDGKTTLSD